MSRVNVGVIGCGAISREHLAYITADPRLHLAAVCDRTPIAASYTAKQHGAEGWFTDHQVMLREANLAAVHVLTPPATHRRLVTDALDAGLHVVCEKPIALSANELRAMVRLADAQGLRLIESQNYRFNNEVLALQELAESGELGTIVHVDLTYSLDIASGGRFADRHVPSPTEQLGGGAVHDFLPHMAYLALHFFGYPPVVRSAAHWRNRSGNSRVKFDELEAIIEFADGSAFVRFSSRAKPDSVRLVVRGTKGTAECEMFAPFVRVDRVRSPKELASLLNHVGNGTRLAAAGVRNLRDKVLQHTTYHGMKVMLGRFYDGVIDGSPSPIDTNQMVRCSELIDALLADA